MTNTIKHAKGNQVYVSFKERQRFLDIQITNNGEQPKEEIKEAGGLILTSFSHRKRGRKYEDQ